MVDSVHRQPLPRILLQPGSKLPQRGSKDLYITTSHYADGTSYTSYNTKKAQMADMYYTMAEPNYDCGCSSKMQTFADISGGIQLLTGAIGAIKDLFSKSS